MTVETDTKPCATSCCGQSVVFDGASPAYRRILTAVIAINAAAFIAVALGSLSQESAALAANALDFLADSATYAISLWVIGRSTRTRAGAALLKGASLAVVAVAVLSFAIWRAMTGAPPQGNVITGLGVLGFLANLLAALLLVRFRDGDANVRSVWLCTRNDLIESLAVVVAGGLVWLTGSRWPDLITGVFLAGVFLQSAYVIVRQSQAELRAAA
ncbi:cation transporter [Caulobacter sp. DWR3-1-2]|uniref:cation transporter n=1 Tax=Caulobacter sp. DWR3-1-2 TaxID=2804647 RepID=UPI003CF7E26D